jgi:hypothetical protein
MHDGIRMKTRISTIAQFTWRTMATTQQTIAPAMSPIAEQMPMAELTVHVSPSISSSVCVIWERMERPTLRQAVVCQMRYAMAPNMHRQAIG